MSHLVRLSHVDVDLDGAVVQTRDGVTTVLTPLEVRLLRYLLAHRDRVVASEELLVEVWGYRPGVQSRAVTFTVNRLRAKIEQDKSTPEHLLTVRGHGFQLVVPAGTASWWVGPAETLAMLDAAVAEHGRVVVVGRAGLGKTAVVQAWAEQRFGDVARVELSEVADRASFVTALATSLALDVSGTLDALEARIAGACSEHRITLVLEGAERIANELASWCAALESPVVVTSRVPVPGMHAWSLPSLDADDASALFLRWAREQRDDWDAEPATLLAIVDRLDRLPLALRLTAASAHWFSARELWDRLRRDLGTTATASTLTEAIRWSIALLTPEEQQVFAWLDVFGGPVTAAQLSEVLPVDAVPALQALVRHGLVHEVGRPPRARLGVGVRAAAAAALDASGERQAAERAHRDWALGAEAVLLDELIRVHDRDLAAHPEAAVLAMRRALPMLPTLYPVPWIAARIERFPTLPDDACVQAYWAWATWRLGEVEQARHRLDAAAAGAQQRGDTLGLSQAWSFTGALLQEAGARDEALPWFERTVELLRDAGERGPLGRALNALAIARTQQEAYDTARDLLFEGLEVSTEDDACQVLLLNSLGNLYLREGRLADAARSYERAYVALGERARGPERTSRIVVETNLAAVRVAQGRLDEAAELYERAVDAHRRSGRRRSLGLARASLGRIHHLSDRLEDAIEAYRAAVALLEAVGDRLTASWTRAFHVAALLEADQPDEAARSERLLREHEAAIGTPIGEALEALVEAHRAERDARLGDGSWPEAAEALERLRDAAHPQLAPMVERLTRRHPAPTR